MTLRLHTELTADASGLRGEVKLSEQDLAQLRAEGTRAGDAVSAGAAKMTTSNEEAARSFRQTGQAATQAGSTVSRYTRLQEELRRAVAAGTVTQQEANRVLQAGQGAVEAGSRRVSAATNRQRQFGLAAQQSAFQIQDFFVQVQAGVPVMRSLSMQLPQLLGSFGVWGAVVGAAVAVSASLVPSLFDTADAADSSRDAADALAQAQDGLNATLLEGVESAGQLVDKYDELTESARSLERLRLQAALRANQEALEAQTEAIDDQISSLEARRALVEQSVELGNDSAEAGLLLEAFAAIDAFRSGGSAQELAEELTRIAGALGEGGHAALQLVDGLLENVGAIAELEGDAENLRKALLALRGELAETGDAASKSAKRAVEALEGQIASLGREARVLAGDMTEVDAKVESAEAALEAAGVSAELAKPLIDQLRQALLGVAGASEEAKAAEDARRDSERAAERQARALQQLTERTGALALETQVLRGEISETDAAVEAAAAALEAAGVSAADAEPALAAFRAELEGNSAAAEAAAEAQDRHNEALRRASRLVESTRTPLERIADELQELERTRAWIASAEGAEALAEAGVSAEAALEGVNRRAAELGEEMAAAELELQPLGQAFEDFAGEVEDDFKEAFKEAFREGEGGFQRLMDSFEELFLDMLAELAFQALAKPVIVPIVQQVGQSAFGLSPAQAQAGIQQAGLPSGGLPGGLPFDQLLGGSGELAGVLNTPIFSSLPADFIGPPMASQVFTLGNALSGVGLGFGLGSFLGPLVGGDPLVSGGTGALGGVAGAAIGSVIPGIGTVLGALLGGAGGGLLGGFLPFGPKPTVGPNSEAAGTLRNGLVALDQAGADNGGDIQRSTALLSQMAQAIDQVGAAAQRDVGAQQVRVRVMEKTGEITVEAAGQVGTFRDETEATLFAVRALAGNLAGLDEEAEAAVASASSVEEAIARLNEIREAELRVIRREAYERDLNRQVLDIVNPGAGTLEAERQAQEERIGVALELGTELTEIERLHYLRRLQLVQRMSDRELRLLQQSASRLDVALAGMETARRDVAEALDDMISPLDGFAAAAEAFAERLDRLRSEFLVDNQLSPLAPLEREAEARRLLEETVAAARGGDPDALGRVEQDLRAFLQVSRQLYASGEPYQENFSWALDLVEGLGTELAPAQDTAAAQLDVLEEIRDLLSIPGTTADQLRSRLAAAGADMSVFGPLLDRLAAGSAEVDRETEREDRERLAQQYSDLLNRARRGDEEAARRWIFVAPEAVRLGVIERAAANQDAEDVEERGYGFDVPRFEGGGDHAGGMRLVGETGVELENTGPSRIYSTAQMGEILGRGLTVSAEAAAGSLAALQEVTRAVERNTGQVMLLRGEVAGRRADAERQHAEATHAQRTLGRKVEAAVGAGGWKEAG
jgi:hypothetical protein